MRKKDLFTKCYGHKGVTHRNEAGMLGTQKSYKAITSVEAFIHTVKISKELKIQSSLHRLLYYKKLTKHVNNATKINVSLN